MALESADRKTLTVSASPTSRRDEPKEGRSGLGRAQGRALLSNIAVTSGSEKSMVKTSSGSCPNNMSDDKRVHQSRISVSNEGESVTPSTGQEHKLSLLRRNRDRGNGALTKRSDGRAAHACEERPRKSLSRPDWSKTMDLR